MKHPPPMDGRKPWRGLSCHRKKPSHDETEWSATGDILAVFLKPPRRNPQGGWKQAGAVPGSGPSGGRNPRYHPANLPGPSTVTTGKTLCEQAYRPDWVARATCSII